ncbi:MAG: STAS domain-containing protein [Gammaproteobacteria bacterium]|nr:STAS domain-containing protein [Gammaproteobacteria bacterium]
MAASDARLETEGSPRLVGAVNLESVTGLVSAADALFAKGREACTIDLSGLEKSDSATVALLLEWKRRARRKGADLSYSNIPDNLLDIARISQLESLLQA